MAPFAADLPNGTYDVTLSLGGAYTLFDQMEVSLEGAAVAVVTPPSGQIDTRTFRVSVQDGQLTLRVRDLGGSGSPYVALNALAVVRVPNALSVSINPGSVSEAGGANAATGTVNRTGDLSQSLTVSLSSSDTTEATVPATVTIPAGQASATFAVAAIDDTAFDGAQVATVSASATGYASGSAAFTVTDNELPALTVSVNPQTVAETAGASAATGTVTRTGNLSQSLTVTLSSSDTTEVKVPATVTIPAGAASVTFAVAAVDDTLLDYTQTATISASAAGYTGGATAVSVTDNERPTLTVSVNPGTISEAGGATAATGAVFRDGNLSQAVTVSLVSSDTTEARVPATVTIPAGQASATFAVAAVDDTTVDGTQPVTISASATGHNGGSAGLSVTDNDRVEFASGSFDFGTTSSPVASGYTQVANTTAFTAARGYGWASGTIGAADSNSGTATTRDFNSTADGTFAVAVPNGTYSVTVTMGDAKAARNRMGVYLEGTLVADITTRKNEFITRTFTVAVSDGQLTLRLRDLGGNDPQAVINALQFTRTGGFQALMVAPSPTAGTDAAGETTSTRPSSASGTRGTDPSGRGQPVREEGHEVNVGGPAALPPVEDDWLFGGVPIDLLFGTGPGR